MIAMDSLAAQTMVRRSRQEDRAAVIALLRATAFFRPDELEIAIEVLDEALALFVHGTTTPPFISVAFRPRCS